MSLRHVSRADGSSVGLGARPPATPGPPVRLAADLWQVAGPGITHPWDAAGYLVLGDHGAVLVDCGTGLAPDALDQALLSCGVPLDRLDAVFATHGHLDHVGDGARLAALGVPVLVHHRDAEAVRTGDPLKTCAESLYGSTFAGFEPVLLHDRASLDLGGSRLEVVHTPGHTPGSVCVVVEVGGRRVLLAGDTLWGGFSADIGSDADAWHGSLALLEDLGVDQLSFGHGINRLLDDPAGRLAEARARFATYFDPWFRPPKMTFRY